MSETIHFEIHFKKCFLMKELGRYILFTFFIVLITSGFSTINERQIPANEDLSGKGLLIVTAFDSKGDMKNNKPTSHQMLLAVYDENPDDDDSKLMHEGEGVIWQVDNLMPGKYYLVPPEKAFNQL